MELLIGGVLVFGVLEAVIKLLKHSFQVSERWLPLTNVVVSVAFSVGAVPLGLIQASIVEAGFAGLLIGLALGGFYDLRQASGLKF